VGIVGSPLMEVPNTEGIDIDNLRSVSHDILEMMQWKANMKSYALYQMVPLPVSVSDHRHPKSPLFSHFGSSFISLEWLKIL